MELIAEIHDKDIWSNSTETKDVKYELRKASRAVVMNEVGDIALLFVSKRNYHKLPGGGIEKGEDRIRALKREILEEVGAHIAHIGEIGFIIEFRDQHEFMQFSYCYYCSVHGDIREPAYTEQELASGCEIKWVSLDEAISLISNDSPEPYAAQFIRSRDLQFLKKAKELDIRGLKVEG
ncbi:NUDIX domain-containing protein [Paenibacillus sp. 1_12]|uniref:NUDIX domain-containing protein n=1 Tax=Paenibacillus sp. 1_12 TaxID=1566278 RepID=UPI0008E25192|nr:NUDIX domain-containing protein [Paenibacillus sp. 1_12]SFL34679.1 NUDIX domain-containing protein [Paenibacillus sp. 1_12]